MKLKHSISIVFATLVLSCLLSCNKEEGEGGTGIIEGKIYTIIHNDDDYDLSVDTLVAAKQDVFIVYGDDIYYGDDQETGEDGTYQFKFLTPGTYTIYAYSELASGEKVAVKKTVELGRGETVNVDNIYIEEGKANGTSMIRGWVWATYFNGDNETVRTTWGYEQRVYIQRLGEPYYFNDVRVGNNGTFYFQRLQPDTYIVYTYSQYADETPYPVSDTVTVDAAGHIYDADTLRVRIKA